MDKRIPYGIMNYAEIIQKKGYFIDKTGYIERLEGVQNPVFLRPRRFGKSLFCSMLQYYYDICEAHRFLELFGHTWIGQNPTESHNQYIVLKFDFSVILVSDDLKETESAFNRHCTGRILETWYSYPDFMQSAPTLAPDEKASIALSLWLGYLQKTGSPQVYVSLMSMTILSTSISRVTRIISMRRSRKGIVFSGPSLRFLKRDDRPVLLQMYSSPVCFPLLLMI